MTRKPKQGDMVLVEWRDIVTDMRLTTTAPARNIGWIHSIDSRTIVLCHSKYDDARFQGDDDIETTAIPRGCVDGIITLRKG